MIYAFTGKTGSGKTFKMIELAYKHWKKGTDIYSNTVLFFVEKDWLFKFHKKLGFSPVRGKIVYFNEISEILEVKNGLILFDEAQVLFNARLWESLPAEFMYKLQQHRKHKLDLICTTQNMGTIDITYRRLVHKWYHCEDVFALLWKRNPSWLSLHRIKEKDVDMLYNSVDDLNVEDVRVRYFLIHRLKRVLYDTLYDIGFKRFQIVWLSYFDKEMKNTKKFWIIPKNQNLKNVLREISSQRSALGLNKYQTSRGN